MFLNRSYSQMDVLTKASITLQTIDEEFIHRAQIFSSNGNIFGVTDKTSQITLVVWKGSTDITDNFNDIVWKKFSINSGNYEEDLAWQEAHKGLKSFTLSRDEINKQAKIQVEVYSDVDNVRKLVAVDYISFINVNDLQGTDTPPSNPSHGDLWLNNTVIPPKLMMWDNNSKMWIEVTVAGDNQRNLIRNSNFYKATLDHWENISMGSLEIESFEGKKWLRLKRFHQSNSIVGTRQTCNAVKRSVYSFQILAKHHPQTNNANANLSVTFYSKNQNNVKTLLKTQIFNISSTNKVYTVSFSTIDDTEKIQFVISGEESSIYDIVFTNTKLEHNQVPTEWELAIEDIQDALDNKVGNTHEEVFDSFTDHGSMQGIYVDTDATGKKNYYFNASYIKSGKLLGEYIEAKNLTVKNNQGTTTLKVDSNGDVSLNVSSLTIKSEQVATNSDVTDLREEIFATLKSITNDPMFIVGENGIDAYNGRAESSFLKRIQVSDAPFQESNYVLECLCEAGYGGIWFTNRLEPDSKYIIKLVAKLPGGYELWYEPGNISKEWKWKTSNSGTGQWEEYIVELNTNSAVSNGYTNVFMLFGSSPYFEALTIAYADIQQAKGTAWSEEINSIKQEITPDAIINTVKNSVESNGEKTFAQTSVVKQTAKDVTYDFLTKSGNNMLKNSMFADRSTYGWTFWTAHMYGNQDYFKPGDMWIGNDSSTSHGLFYTTQGFPAKPNTKYTISIAMLKEVNVKGGSIRLIWKSDDTNINNTVATTTVINPIWDGQRHSYTITSPGVSSIKYCMFAIRHEGSNAGADGYLIKINKPCMMEGESAPYQLAPNEVINGSTIIDGTGVTINNGAIKIKNNAGAIVLQGDSNGNLSMTGSINTSALVVNGCGISVKNSNGDVVLGADNSGNLWLSGVVYSNSGSIGGFWLRDGAIYGTNVGMGVQNKDWAFWAGGDASGSAPFRVGHAGEVIATNITINNGGLAVKNNSNQTVLSGDSNGNLWVQNTIKVGQGTSGSIEIFNTSSKRIGTINQNGIFLNEGLLTVTSGEITQSGIGAYPQGIKKVLTVNSDKIECTETEMTGSQLYVYTGEHGTFESRLTSDFLGSGAQTYHQTRQNSTMISLYYGEGTDVWDRGTKTVLTAKDITTPTIYTSNWFRSQGNTGWYNETYGGGWMMQDVTWIRAYNGKAIYTTNVMRADSGFQVCSGNSAVKTGADNSVRIQTPSGWGDIGAKNTSYFHFGTDRPKFYFYQPIEVNSTIQANSSITARGGAIYLGQGASTSWVGFYHSSGTRRGYIGKGDPSSDYIYIASEVNKYIVTIGHFCPSATGTYYLGTNSPKMQWKGVCCEGGTFGTSDVKAKENIERLDGTIVNYDEVTNELKEYQLSHFKSNTRAIGADYYEFIKDRFKPSYYNYKLSEEKNELTGEHTISPEDEYNMLKNVGFIAQDYDIETDKVAQEFIFKNEDGSLAYNHMSYVTVGMIALQEAVKKIESLQEEVDSLKNKINN